MTTSLTDDRRQALFHHCQSNAEKYLAKGNVARAFSHFLVCAKLSPKLEILDPLVFTLRELGMSLEKNNRYDELFNCYQQALEIFPNSPEMNNNLGAHLFRLGNIEEAATYFLQAVTVNPTFVAAKENLDNVSNTLMERWHFPMLNDEQRNKAYYLAIEKAVKSGYKTVLDIGTGTGILSMFAVRNGAERVYACDVSKLMFTLSRNVLENNNMADGVKIYNKHSSDLNVPEHLPSRVSLVVTEILDSGLLGELILPTLSYAWKNLLLPPRENSSSDNSGQFGKVIPAGATIWASVIECPEIRYQNRIVKDEAGEINLKCLTMQRARDFYPYTSERLDAINGELSFLTNPVPILRLDFNDPKKIEEYMNEFAFTIDTNIQQSGIMDAVVTWFTLLLDEEHTLSTATKTCWEQAVYPIQTDLSAVKDDTLKLKAEIKGDSLAFHCSINQNVSDVGEISYPLRLNHYEIAKLNDCSYWDLLKNSLMVNQVKNCRVLDMSNIPLAALMCLKIGAQQVSITKNNSLHTLMEAIINENSLNSSAIKTTNYEDALTENWDIIILDVVDPSGTFKQDILEDTALLRYSSDSGKFMPDQVGVQCVLVESDELLEMNRVVNDEKVLGFKIAESINNFKVSTHCDFVLDQVTHKLLSNSAELFHFNLYGCLSEATFTNTVTINIVQTGIAHALLFWFKLQYGDQILDTVEHKNTWKQACIVFDQPISVKCGKSIELVAKYSHGCITIDCTT